MRIGFDISQTGSGKAGCGYFAHAMIQAMLELAPQHHYLLFPHFGDFYFDASMPTQSPYSGHNIHYGPSQTSCQTAREFWSRPDVENCLEQPDIIHSNNFWCPHYLASSRLIYTFYDMGFAVNPDWTTEANRTGCFNGVFRSALTADWIVAISEASRKHYLDTFPNFPQDRIRVIYPCSRFTHSTSEGKQPQAVATIPPKGFWLNVGTIEPRKNQYRLLEAYSRYLASTATPMPLVLAGGDGWLMDDFQKNVHTLGIDSQVIMTGYVTDEELIWLYRNCYANLYPSLFEGFGLPVLEGMQFGAPTIASNTSSIPEVAGRAAVLLAPEDVEAWAQALHDLTNNPAKRDHLAVLAHKQAGAFSWEQSATALLELYKEALISPKRLAMPTKQYSKYSNSSIQQLIMQIQQLETEKKQIAAKLHACEANRAARSEIIETQNQQLTRIPQLEAETQLLETEKNHLAARLHTYATKYASLYTNKLIRVGVKLGVIPSRED